ncbi:hypothetical protein OSB04_018243 [Centaurea solstitialis]|uniref:FAD-binding FR-type domain-containing protein n=1 Tax=Centaurea solstitialis TaxID=347529 RepID=A0AA38TPE5_9ASTR|nr:hypothetical protein OSB04_018243 [Centaurea solstitialis]
MSVTTTTIPNPLLPHLSSHAPPRTLPFPMATILRRHLTNPIIPRRRSLAVAAAAVRQQQQPDTTLWTPAPLANVKPAAESMFHVTIDVSDSPDLASSYTLAGQYLQLRIADVEKPSFLAIASPPSMASTNGVFEFLVKSIAGSTAEILCGLGKGDFVELSPVMGKGFSTDRISPPEDYQSVLIFATGSGISPIRSLIESGFSADKRSDVRLYYGARNLQRMAYQDRFKTWESSGVTIVPVLSQPDDSWVGETGYVQVDVLWIFFLLFVGLLRSFALSCCQLAMTFAPCIEQAAFARAKKAYAPESTGAVLCGQKQMAEEVTSILVGNGVAEEKILKNF